MKIKTCICAIVAPCLLLAGCIDMTAGPASAGQVTAQASAAVERASAAYYRIKDFADLLLPLLPASYAARLHAAYVIADRAITAARIATTAAEQLAALRDLKSAAATITDVTGVR